MEMLIVNKYFKFQVNTFDSIQVIRLNRNLPKYFNQFSKSKKGDNSVNTVYRVMGIVSHDGDVDS